MSHHGARLLVHAGRDRREVECAVDLAVAIAEDLHAQQILVVEREHERRRRDQRVSQRGHAEILWKFEGAGCEGKLRSLM